MELPDNPDLDQLRTQARELQRAVRGGDPAAIAEVDGPAPDFPLAKAQRALARRFGFATWDRLRRHVEAINARSWTYAGPVGDESSTDAVIRLACLTYASGDARDPAAAARLLTEQPGLASASLAVAAACADVDALAQHLAGHTDAANGAIGPRGWTPLLYLAYSRFDADREATMAAAQLLVDTGADVNEGRFFGGFGAPFTVLTGVLGGGENDQPPHPHAMPLARLLLERGAEANDAQALYNRMFRTEDDFLELLFEFGLGHGDGGPWRRLLPDLLDPPDVIVHDLFGWALEHDQRVRVALLLANGVHVERRFDDGNTSALDVAMRNGYRELADLLRTAGATGAELDAVQTFTAAALAGDADAVASTPAEVIAQARTARPGLMVWAAAQGRVVAIDLLAGAGFDIDVLARGDVPSDQPWQTALHTAVEHDHIEVVRALLALGADRTIHDARFDGTPADWADHLGRPEIKTLLSVGPDSAS